MATSKQGSGLDTALPAGFLPCNVQHTHRGTNTQTNYSLTKLSCSRQGKRKLRCCSGCCCCYCLWCFSLCLADLPSLRLCLHPSYKHNWLTDDLMRLTEECVRLCVCVCWRINARVCDADVKWNKYSRAWGVHNCLPVCVCVCARTWVRARVQMRWRTI